MHKGFILYNYQKIPFVINDFKAELFSDSSILDDFRKEYGSKTDFTIKGECFDSGSLSRPIFLYVREFFADTLYLHCYIVNMLSDEPNPDLIGFESPFLDDIFRYKYNYLEMVRDGINLDLEPKDIYIIPFAMNNDDYEAIYRIGRDNRMGLLEDFDRKGELRIPLQNKTIQECYALSVIVNRLAKFMIARSYVPFKRITLYKNGIKHGWLYTPNVTEGSFSGHEFDFCKMDVMKYIPKILYIITKDPGNTIEHSVPLGHLGGFNSLFSPQRFMEQVMAFEYIFDKIDHKKAQDSGYPLKKELKEQFDKYPGLLAGSKLSSDNVSEKIKEIRRKIAHGYEYHYDFGNDIEKRFLMLKLDILIQNMSLSYIGFTYDEIEDYNRKI